METLLSHWAEILTIIINIVVVVGSYYRIVNRVEQLEKKTQEIETTRLNNVKVLREIYDGKVEDSKQYSKSLFDIREHEIKEISKQLTELKVKVDHQNETLNKTLTEIMIGMAEVRTHVKSCPYYQNKKDL